MRTRVRRRGIGIFFGVLLMFVLLVAFVGFARMMFSRQVTSSAARQVLKRRLRSYASSVAEEAVHYVKSRVNRPGTELFGIFRREVYAGESGAEKLHVDVELAGAVPVWSDLSLDSLEVAIVYQRQFSRMPYEKYGVVEVSVEVSKRLGLAGSVSLRLKVGYPFKVVLAGVPRPYDQTTVFVRKADSLVEGVNDWLRDAGTIFASLRRERDEVLDLLEGVTSPAVDRDYWKRTIEGVSIPGESFLWGRVHLFPEPLTVFSVEEYVLLSWLDLKGALHDAAGRLEGRRTRYEQALSELRSSADSPRAWGRYVESLRSYVAGVLDCIESVRSFQEKFSEYSGPARERLESFSYKLTLAEFARKTTWYLPEDALGGNDINAVMAEFLRRHPVVNGVVFVDNPTSQLALHGERIGRLEGKWIIVSSGKIRVDKLYAPGDDSMGVIASYGRLSVEDSNAVALIAMGETEFMSGAVVDGCVVFDEIGSFAEMRTESVKVHRRRMVYSGRTTPEDPGGAFDSYYYVSVAPYESYRVVE